MGNLEKKALRRCKKFKNFARGVEKKLCKKRINFKISFTTFEKSGENTNKIYLNLLRVIRKLQIKKSFNEKFSLKTFI